MTDRPSETTPRAPIFLHTGWRTRGTWVWAGLRRDPGACAFYEPLHEAMATLSPETIAAVSPQAWNSGHEAMAPYWEEFLPLLEPGRTGVPGYEPRFATQRAFAAAGEDPELVAWIGRLIDHARAQGRVAVLKLCRGGGRVGLIRAAFPDALHLMLIRRPDAQWASACHQARHDENPYFLRMPVQMLAANSRAKLVCQMADAFALGLPALDDAAPEALEAAATQVMASLSEPARYRAFLAWWLACALSGLRGGTEMVDVEMLTWSARARQSLGERIAAASGLELRLRRPVGSPPPAPLGEDQASAHLVALNLLEARRDSLPPDGYHCIWSQLAAGLVRPSAVEFNPLPRMHPFAPPLGVAPSEEMTPRPPAEGGRATARGWRSVLFSGRG